MSQNRPPFPEVIDASLMSAWRSCPTKCQLEYFHHYKSKNPSVHLHAGGAFARGLEVSRKAYFDQGLPQETAEALGVGALLEFYGNFECPEDSAKSATRMAGALEYYFSQYPFHSESAPPHRMPSGAPAIEFSFAEPIEVFHPETGNPLIFAGRFDQVVDFSGGVWGEDDKTTSSLGTQWAGQWDMRGQFTAYCWGAGRAGLKLDGFLVRGISILKTKYDTAQAITYRPQWQIDRWYEQTCFDLQNMIQAWKSNRWSHSLDEACNSYGGCMFKRVCLAQDPTPWLEIGFERRRWDPVERTEEVLS